MRAQQEIADVLPRPLGARPRTEKLDRIAIRLRPLAVSLERFVKPPAEIFLLLFFRDQPALERRRSARGALHRFVPAELPLVESEAVDGINIRGAPDLVMAENPGLKENPHRLALAGSGLDGKPLEHAMQFGGKLRRDQRVGRRRIDAERRARAHRHGGLLKMAGAWSGIAVSGVVPEAADNPAADPLTSSRPARAGCATLRTTNSTVAFSSSRIETPKLPYPHGFTMCSSIT